MKIQKNGNRGFTLVELLLVMSIIAILSGLGLSIMAGAEQDALESRTKSGIERISQILNKKMEENMYRILPVRLPAGTDPKDVRNFQRDMLVEMMRVELPFDRAHVDPTVLFPSGDPGAMGLVANSDRPQISARYHAFIDSQNQKPGSADWFSKTDDPELPRIGAECLYAILSLGYDENGNKLVSTLRKREIADTDDDGVLEVVDAFGDPVSFAIVDENGLELDPTNSQVPQNYRIRIQSVNLKDANPSVVSSQ